jgi:hypothetical protein
MPVRAILKTVGCTSQQTIAEISLCLLARQHILIPGKPGIEVTAGSFQQDHGSACQNQSWYEGDQESGLMIIDPTPEKLILIRC